MVGVAQLVRAPGCGPGGRGFKSHHSPSFKKGVVFRSNEFYIFAAFTLPSSRGLGHWPFTPATGVRIPLGAQLKGCPNEQPFLFIGRFIN